MLYNQLFTMIKPFFISRWGWALSNTDMLESYVNISIQDVWNFYDWTFKIKQEVLTTPEASWEFLKWKLSSPIDRTIDLYDEHWNSLQPTSWRLDNDNECKIWYDFILTTTDIESIDVRYYSSFEFIEYNTNWTDTLPMPNKFLPALLNKIYDLASPISYFEDDNVVPRYQIAVRQLNELKQFDWVSADVYLSPDPTM